MVSKFPNAVQVQEAEERIRPVDFYRAEACVTVEYRMTLDDESLSKIMHDGRCEMKYRVTGRARHTTEFAIQLEELAAKIRK